MKALVAAFVLVLGAFLAPGAAAHAVLLETAPGDRAVIADSPDAIVLRFNEAVEPVAVGLIDEAGATVPIGIATSDAALRVTPVASLARGGYILSWRVISADAHPVAGAFQFAVGEAPRSWAAAAMARGDADWTLVAIANRAVHLVAMMIAIGGAIYGLLVGAALRPAIRWSAAVAALTAVLGLGIEGGLVLDARLDRLLGIEPWRVGAATTRGMACAFSLAGLAAILLGARATGTLIAVAGFVVSGHAATAPSRWLATPTLLIHVAMAAFWIGSFIPLRRASRREVVRFSSAAIVLVPILVIAGLTLATLQVERPSALAATPYGATLLVKIGLVGVLVALAAYNRLVLTPRLPASAGRLRASIAVELGIATMILIATAALGQLVPPRSVASVATGPRAFAAEGSAPVVIVASGNRVATIEIAPGAVGRNAIAVGIADTVGRPVEAREVIAILSNPGAGIEGLERPLERAGDGLYRYEGPEFAVPGIWTLRIDALLGDFDKAIFTAPVSIRPSTSP